MARRIFNKLLKYFNKRGNLLAFVLRVVLILLPFIAAFGISLFLGYNGSLKAMGPYWNDEVWWHTQVDAVVNYGSPLGYYMYNEGEPAQWGTWGPWGAAPLFPYALFGKIFGWNLNSMGLANLTFLSLSLLVLLLLTNPSNKQIIILGAVYLTSFVTIGYSLTSMSEGLRYSVAITLAAIVIWIERCTNTINEKLSRKRIICLVLFCLWTLLLIQIYVIFTLAVLVIALLILRRVKFKKYDIFVKLLTAFIATVIVGAISYWLYNLTRCRYVSSYLHESIINAIKTEGLYKGFVLLINNFISNISTISYTGITSVIADGSLNGDVWVYTLLVIVGVFFVIMRDIVLKRFRNVYTLMSAFFILGVVGINCMLYSSFSWGIRVENIGLIMALILLVFSDRYKHVVNYILLSVLILGSAWTWYSQLMNERNSILVYEEMLSSEKAILREVIDISPDKDAWDNTVAIYGGLNFWALSIPEGAGSNFMLTDVVCTKSGYAVMPPHYLESYQAGLEANGYSLIHVDDVYAVFQRN